MIKKFGIIFTVFIICNYLYAQDFSIFKVLEINQGKDINNIQLRDNDSLDNDDFTGNYIAITDDGSLYINCWDLRTLYEVNVKDNTYIYKANLSVIQNEHSHVCLTQAVDKYLLFTGSWGRCKLYDVSQNLLKFEVLPDEWDFRLYSESFYYDMQSDILFLKTSDSKIHSVIHPTMDQEQNKKNYRDPVQTKAILLGKSDVKLKNISINNNGEILSNGKIIGPDFQYKQIGKYRYRVYTKNVAVYEDITKDPITRIRYNNIKDSEVNESVAVHPSGDIYILRFDRATNLHTLYKVENTWDPAWRKQWYKEHK